MGLIKRWLFALCQSRSGQVLKPTPAKETQSP